MIRAPGIVHQLAGLVAAGLGLAGLGLAGLGLAGPSPWWPPAWGSPARRPGGRRPGARRPRSAVRGPWGMNEGPPTPGPKKRAGSLAARALALFYTVGFT